MNKYLATTGTVAILAAALLVSGRAEAGGATSAASKYSNNNTSQVAGVYLASGNRQARRADFGITEFSSSSARTHAAKYR